MKISCIPEITEDSVKLFNVILLGTCFCLVFTGFNTMSQTQGLFDDILCQILSSVILFSGPCVQLRIQYNSFKQSNSVPSKWNDNVRLCFAPHRCWGKLIRPHRFNCQITYLNLGMVSFTASTASPAGWPRPWSPRWACACR